MLSIVLSILIAMLFIQYIAVSAKLYEGLYFDKWDFLKAAIPLYFWVKCASHVFNKISYELIAIFRN